MCPSLKPQQPDSAISTVDAAQETPNNQVNLPLKSSHQDKLDISPIKALATSTNDMSKSTTLTNTDSSVNHVSANEMNSPPIKMTIRTDNVEIVESFSKEKTNDISGEVSELLYELVYSAIHSLNL